LWREIYFILRKPSTGCEIVATPAIVEDRGQIGDEIRMPPDTVKKSGWAVMGTGTVAAEQMVSAIRALGHSPLWVASRSETRANHFARDADIPRSTTDPHRAIDDPHVAFVYIAAAVERRPFYIRAAASAGKHIVCDGPIAATAKTAAELARICEAAGVVLAISQRARASAVHQTMERLVADGAIGALRSLTILRGGPYHPEPTRWSSRPVDRPDIFLEMCVEDIDLARFLTGEEPGEALAIADRNPAEGMPDHLAYVLRMGETLFQAHESYSTADMESIVVAAGSDGILIASGTLGHRGSGTLVRRLEGRNEFIPIRERDAYLATLEQFIDAVEGRSPPLANGADGYAALAAAEAVMKSAKRGRIVAT
jgi:1,5-anhydro-D-fructose reductase (1,5-anhydro-D-mannitol-forming)